MGYEPQEWNNEGTKPDTPFTAQRMRHIEDGIFGEEERALAAEELLTPLAQKGKANGVASLDEEGVLPEGQLPSSVENGSAIASEPTVYVSKSGKDTNTGVGPANAFLTIRKAVEYLEALTGGTGVIDIGVGTWVEPKLVRPPGCLIRGKGKLTVITLKNAENSNVIQDAAWGSKTTVNDGGGVEKLMINGSKANQTLKAPRALLTATTTISTVATVLHVDDASAFKAASLTNGTIWVGKTLCEYTGLVYTGKAFKPSAPTTTGWEFTGVKTVSGETKTYYPEALILPGASFGHGIALQSSRAVVRDVMVEQCVGSPVAIQGSASASAFECKLDNVRGQRCDRYGYVEVLPNATDGLASIAVGANGALGDLLIMAVNWQWHGYHPSGVYNAGGASSYYGARLAPFAVQICASEQEFYGFHPDSFPFGLVCINFAWVQELIKNIYVRGHAHEFGPIGRSPRACSGSASAFSFYGQSDPGTLTALNINLGPMGLRERFLHAIALQPTAETIFAAGSEYKTPASGAEGTKLQVLNALDFSPLGSAIAGTCEVVSSAGTKLDTINYTATKTWACWTVSAVPAKATTMEVDNGSGLVAAGGTLAVYPQSTSEGAVESLAITYTKASEVAGKWIIEGIPAEGNGSIPEELPAGCGMTQAYLEGVTSTGAGNVVIPTGSVVEQVGGSTNRRIGTLSGSAPELDIAYHRRVGTPVYPSSSLTTIRMRVSGRILDHPNPFYGSVEIKAGETSGEVAHNLSTTPTQYFASPTTFTQKEYKVEVTATAIKVVLKEAAAGSAVKFNVWAAVGL